MVQKSRIVVSVFYSTGASALVYENGPLHPRGYDGKRDGLAQRAANH